MLLDRITASDVLIQLKTDNWEDAIRKSSQTLLEKGSIESRYIDAMIKVVHENGPYIVISKHIALAHARTECGALHTDITFATLDPAIHFNAGALDPVKLIITLSATDADTHLDLLGELSDILMDEEKSEALFNAGSAEEFVQILHSN
ncbi:MAG: PTS sugar transporter subunit IIA [Ruminococcus sp.]|jgi:PTS system mannitol-specific IIA component/PTS system ascorbate-specific IIA component|nr:PTS sugar transporter subunit IIA [Ruminococcus sp.]